MTFATGGACSPAQLLLDPGFEATDASAGFPYTNPDWTSTSDNFGTAFCDVNCGGDGVSAVPHDGAFWAWLGGAQNPEVGTVSQDVVIPAGDTRFLNFWLFIGAIGDGSSNMDVSVDGNVITSFPEPAAAEAGYTQRGVDISNFADGGTHTVTFTYTSTTTATSNYSLDDVTIDCTAARPTLPLSAFHAPTGPTARTR